MPPIPVNDQARQLRSRQAELAETIERKWSPGETGSYALVVKTRDDLKDDDDVLIPYPTVAQAWYPALLCRVTGARSAGTALTVESKKTAQVLFGNIGTRLIPPNTMVIVELVGPDFLTEYD